MPQGLEVYNADGTIRNSVTDYFGKILGQVNASTPNQTGGAWATMPWPYPEIPADKRVVYCYSNGAYTDVQFSYSYAFFQDDTNTTIYYSQDCDRFPITIVFMSS